MKSDPTESGGLFGRRQERTIRYKTAPKAVSNRRRTIDQVVAGAIAATMSLISLLMLGALTPAWLWLVAHTPALASHIFWALLAALVGILLSMMGCLALLLKMDRWWILARRASGRDQHKGVLSAILTVAVAALSAGFLAWLLLLGGLAGS